MRSILPHSYFAKYKVRGQKYPFLVSYHQLPWMVVEPGATKFHETVGEHYASVLDIASKVQVPSLVYNNHPAVPVDRWLHLLPGSVYVLPVSATQPLANWAPYGWDGVRAGDDPNKLAMYGLAHRDFAKVTQVVEFMSPDLRLCCNAVGFTKPHCVVRSNSSLAQLSGVSESNGEFTLFQFYRPNRSPSELVKPLERFYVHKPDLSVLDALTQGWKSKTSIPKRSARDVAGPMAFKPPVCYQLSLPDRLGVVPGDAFGRRDLMWGYWM
jgi:hypothetical protein